ncbi:MAG: hypothetical protein AAF694_18440 [Bacteroidota bacterium]
MQKEKINKNKLFDLLDALSPQEHKSFRKWIEYRHSKNRGVVLKLYETCKKKDQRDKEFIWNMLFPDKPINDLRFRKVLTVLTRDIEDFMVSNHVLKKSKFYKYFLIREFKTRGLFHQFILAIERFRNFFPHPSSNLTDQKKRKVDGFDHLTHYLIEEENQEYLIQHNQRNERRREPALNQALTDWIILEKLKLAVVNINLKIAQGQTFQSFLTDEIIEAVEENKATLNPLSCMWYQLYKLLSSSEEDLYYETFESLAKHEDYFCNADLTNFFTVLLNHRSVLAIKHNSQMLYQDVYDLYKWGLERKLLHVNGFLKTRQYKNIITLMLKLDDYKKAQFYLEYLKDELPSTEREDAYFYNQTVLFFEKKEFEQVKSRLQQYEFSNVYFRVSGKFLLFKALYELGERDYLEAQLHALRQFIRTQNSFSTLHSTIYKNTARLFERLVKADSLKKLVNLQEAIQDTPTLIHKTWLQEKVASQVEDYCYSFS